MIQLKNLVNESDFSRRTIYRRIKYGSLKAVKIDGKTYVIDNNLSEFRGLPSSKKKLITQTIKAQLNEAILFADESNKKEVVDEILFTVKSFRKKGIIIKGFSQRSIYKKISEKKVTRKPRADRGTIKNKLIKEKLESHILPLAAAIYFQNAQPNIKITVDLMRAFAERNENFYEIAAIPPTTLYFNLNKFFGELGMNEKHTHFNHYNEWFQKRAYTTGAFTDDMEFMDWILGDDNKRNVASAWIYNPVTRQTELKQIKSWNWIEAKTGKYLASINKTSDITTEDVIQTLIEALKKTGIPKKGIIIDNGIGRSEGFQRFINQLNYGLSAMRNAQSPAIILKYGKPYHPTDKDPIERSFGISKDEFDVFFNNFVGDNHKREGKHTSNSLTPEQANFTMSDYQARYNNYITGFYEIRTRTRTIDGIKKQISIREMWADYSSTFVVQPIPDRAFRFALQKERAFKYKGGAFRFNLNGYSSDYLPVDFFASVPGSFFNRKYKILYNPADPTEVDLYSLEYFQDRVEGMEISPGDYICTLRAVRSMDISEKHKMVKEHNKNLEKAVKKLSVNLIPIDVNSIVTGTGAIDAPQAVRKEIIKIIKEEKPLEKISLKAAENVNKKFNMQELTIEDLEKIINEKENDL